MFLKSLLDLNKNFSPPLACSGASSADSHQGTLTVDDCVDLGKVAYLEADYYHTELWMVQALNQLDQGETSSTVDAVTILDYLSYSVYQQGKLEWALRFTKRLLELGKRHREQVTVTPPSVSDVQY